MRPMLSLAFKNRGLLGGIFLVPTFLLVLFSPPQIQDNAILAKMCGLLGWITFLGYAAVRFWSTLYISGRKEKALQTIGPYSVTRNPLYIGSLLFGLSGALILQSLTMLVVTGVVTILYLNLVVRHEERILGEIFGDEFTAYCARTPRFLPRWSLYRADDTILVNLHGMKLEMKRLWVAALMPIFAELCMVLRAADWWPHPFRFP